MFDTPKKRRRRRTRRVYPKKRKKVISKQKGKGFFSRVLELGFHGSIKEFKRQRELAKVKKLKKTLAKNQIKTQLKTFFKR